MPGSRPRAAAASSGRAMGPPHQRAVREVLRPASPLQDQRRVQGSDQPGRGQLGAALDQHEFGVPGSCDLPEQGGPARAWRSLEQDAGTGREGGPDHLQLTPAPATWTDTSLVLVDHDAARFSRPAVVAALLDLVQGIGAGDDLGQLQIADPVQPEDLRDVVGRLQSPNRLPFTLLRNRVKIEPAARTGHSASGTWPIKRDRHPRRVGDPAQGGFSSPVTLRRRPAGALAG